MPDITPPTPTPSQTPVAALDPFVASMLEATNRVLGPDGRFSDKPNPPVELPPPVRAKRQMTVAEFSDMQPDPVAAPPPSATPAETPAAIPAPAAPATAVAPRVTVKPPAPPAQPQTIVVQVPAPTPAAPAPLNPDADFIAALDEDRKEEFQIAQFAESVSPTLKGKSKETLDYFRKVDAYIAAHPEAAPESDEFQEFVTANRPKWSPRERRQVEREMVKSEAAAQVRAETDARMQEQKREIHALRVVPQIEATLSQFNRVLSADLVVPEGIDPIGKEVAAAIATKGYAEAVKEFAVEAPIIAQHQATARAYLDISHDVARFDPQNKTHQWLNSFVQRQGAILAAQPAAAKTRNGRAFLPLHEFADLARKNPAAAQQHWTFTDQDVLDCLAMNAVCQVSGEIKKLEASGFKREKKIPKTENIPNPAAPTPEPPPNTRSNPTPSPGPGQPTAATPVNAAMLDSLVPGASKRILV